VYVYVPDADALPAECIALAAGSDEHVDDFFVDGDLVRTVARAGLSDADADRRLRVPLRPPRPCTPAPCGCSWSTVCAWPGSVAFADRWTARCYDEGLSDRWCKFREGGGDSQRACGSVASS